MKQSLAILLLFATLVWGLAACGQNPSDGTAETTTIPSEEETTTSPIGTPPPSSDESEEGETTTPTTPPETPPEQEEPDVCPAYIWYLTTLTDCYVRTEPRIAPETILKNQNNVNVILREDTSSTVLLREKDTITGGGYESEGKLRNDWYKIDYNGTTAYVTADSFRRSFYCCNELSLSAVLQGQAYYMWDGSFHLLDETENTFAAVDMNGDGQTEVVLESGAENMLVLRTLDGLILGYRFPVSNMVRLYADGTFDFTDTAAEGHTYGRAKLTFSGTTVQTTSLWHIINDGTDHVEYYIGTQRVAKANLDAYIATLEDEELSFCGRTKENVTALLSCPGNNPAEKTPADFTSYDSILATYRHMVELIPLGGPWAFENGSFASLFTFSDKDAYETYCALLHAVGQYDADHGESQNAFGYAQKDLNGDGAQELILLSDRYEILGIFTSTPTPTLVFCYRSRVECSIREDGTLFVCAWGASTYDYRHCAIRSDGTAETLLHYGTFADIANEDESLTYYQIGDDGQRVTLTEEAWNTLHASFLCPCGCLMNEQTKNHGGLVWKPLFSAAAPTAFHLEMWMNHNRRVNLLSLTDGTLRFTVKPDQDAILLSLTASLAEDGSYAFESENLRGRLVFCEQGFWLVVEESSLTSIPPRSYGFFIHLAALG
ncbi:MAG: hypothetical protein IJY42_03065 [Clostridia bacterium]|nr:hypothetical protein [Clostridia bacterium]